MHWLKQQISSLKLINDVLMVVVELRWIIVIMFADLSALARFEKTNTSLIWQKIRQN